MGLTIPATMSGTRSVVRLITAASGSCSHRAVGILARLLNLSVALLNQSLHTVLLHSLHRAVHQGSDAPTNSMPQDRRHT